jgi:hypothetical protein
VSGLGQHELLVPGVGQRRRAAQIDDTLAATSSPAAEPRLTGMVEAGVRLALEPRPEKRDGPGHDQRSNPENLRAPMSASKCAGGIKRLEFNALVRVDHPTLVPKRTDWPYRLRVSGIEPEQESDGLLEFREKGVSW